MKRQCDETRPKCKKCQIRGLECPGFDKIVFRDETPKVKVKPEVAITPATPSVIATKREISQDADVLATDRGNDLLVVPGGVDGPPICLSEGQAMERFPNTGKKLLANARMSIAGQEQWVAANLAEIICPAVAFQGMDNYLITWIDAMLGPLSLLKRPRFLDSALRAVALFNAGRTDSALKPINHFDPSKQVLYEGYYHYIQALKHLPSGIDESTKDRSSSDTLHAAMLLSFYEMFACTTANAYFSHIQGAAALIRSKGPSRMLLTACSRATLMAYRPALVAFYMLTGTQCFLADEEWLRAAAWVHARRADTDEIQDICEDLHVNYVKFPNLFFKVKSACKSLAQAEDNLQNLGSASYALEVFTHVLRFRWDLEQLFQKFMQALEADGRQPHLEGIGSPYWRYFTPSDRMPFRDPFVGSCLCFLWTQVILVNSRLAALHSMIARAMPKQTNQDPTTQTATTSEPNPFEMTENLRSIPNQSRLSIADLRAENLKLALSICNSVRPLVEADNVPHQLSFAIKVAYYALRSSPTAQVFALERLQDIGPSFGAANISDSPQEKMLASLSTIP